MFNINGLKSLNTSKIEETEDGNVIILAPSNTDYFNSPTEGKESNNIKNNSPFYYEEITGDFTVSVKIMDNFTFNYDAGAIFIYESDYKWIKLAYEKSDFDTVAVVSVVTDQTSDDANGVNLNQEWVWLMASRVDDTFALHYSLDGINYDLVRIFRFEAGSTLKVGITAQSPIGGEAVRIFSNYNLSSYRLKDLRSGKL